MTSRIFNEALISLYNLCQPLGLVSPHIIDLWNANLHSETTSSYPVPRIKISRVLLTQAGCNFIAKNYGHITRIRKDREGMLLITMAHELGHTFQYFWRYKKPLEGYRKVFLDNRRFSSPWNGIETYLFTHKKEKLDKDEYISWYAWADGDEDFAEVFSEVIMNKGNIKQFKHRPGVYSKMETILEAGKKVIKELPQLKESIKLKKLFCHGGQKKYECRETSIDIGVPTIPGEYMCWCGAPLIYSKRRIRHGS